MTPRNSPRDDPSPISRLLTVDEVANILAIPARRLYVWRTEGKGPRFVKIGHNLRYRQSDVEAYIDDNVHDPSTDEL